MFCELALWTLVKSFKHWRFILWYAEGIPPTSKYFSSDLWKSHKSPFWWLGVPDPPDLPGQLRPWKPSNSRLIKVVRIIFIILHHVRRTLLLSVKSNMAAAAIWNFRQKAISLEPVNGFWRYFVIWRNSAQRCAFCGVSLMASRRVGQIPPNRQNSAHIFKPNRQNRKFTTTVWKWEIDLHEIDVQQGLQGIVLEGGPTLPYAHCAP